MEIRAVASSRVADIRADFPNAEPVADLGGLILRDDVDLAVLTTPNDLHYAQANAALKAGKHVVVEKPFVPAADEADTLIALAEKEKRKLSVYHNRRWDSDFLTIQKLLAEPRLGTVYRFAMRWDRFRPEVQDRWREKDGPGAGLLYDLGSHMIDQALQLFGMPDWLQANVAAQRPGAVVDDAFDILMGKGALRISLGVSSIAADNALRYRVDGDAGSFVKSGLDVQEAQLRAGEAPDTADFGVEPEAQWGTFTDDNGDQQIVRAERGSWLTFYRQMRNAIESDEPVPVDPRSARDVIAVIEAARQSSDAGKRVPFQ